MTAREARRGPTPKIFKFGARKAKLVCFRTRQSRMLGWVAVRHPKQLISPLDLYPFTSVVVTLEVALDDSRALTIDLRDLLSST